MDNIAPPKCWCCSFEAERRDMTGAWVCDDPDCRTNEENAWDFAQDWRAMFMRLRDEPGAHVFLDGRNEHGSHVLSGLLKTAPIEDEDLNEWAEMIIQSAEAKGFSIGDMVYTIWAHSEAERDETGRICVPEYWEFVRVDVDLTRALMVGAALPATDEPISSTDPVQQGGEHG